MKNKKDNKEFNSRFFDLINNLLNGVFRFFKPFDWHITGDNSNKEFYLFVFIFLVISGIFLAVFIINYKYLK